MTLQERFNLVKDGDTLQLNPYEEVNTVAKLVGKNRVIVKGPSRITGTGRIELHSCNETSFIDADFYDKVDGALTFWVGQRNRMENIRCYNVSSTPDRPAIQLWHQAQGNFENITCVECPQMGILMSVCEDCTFGNWKTICTPGFTLGRMIKIQQSFDCLGYNVMCFGGKYTGLSLHINQRLVINGVICKENGQEGIWFSGAGSEECILNGVVSHDNGSYDIAIHGPSDRNNTVHALKAARIYNPITSNRIVL